MAKFLHTGYGLVKRALIYLIQTLLIWMQKTLVFFSFLKKKVYLILKKLLKIETLNTMRS